MLRPLVRLASALFFAGSFPGLASAAEIEVTTEMDVVADDGLCSLREAVSAANLDAATTGCSAGSGADTIVLAAGTYTLALAPAAEDANAGGDLDVTTDVTVAGAGRLLTTIDAAAVDRIFDVHGGSGRLSLLDLTLTGGRVPATVPAWEGSGGAVRSGSLDLSATRVGFVDNRAGEVAEIGGSHGGAIMFLGSALSLVDSVFEQNASGPGALSIGEGGAVYSSVPPTIVRCRFASNTASFGSAVSANGSGTATLVDSVVEGNVAEGGAAAVSLGGDSTKRVERTAFFGNQAAGSPSALALYGGTPFVRNVTVAGNTCANGSAVYVMTLTSTTIELDHVSVIDNAGGGIVLAANGGSSPILTLRSSVVAGNLAADGVTPKDCSIQNIVGSGALASSGFNVLGTGGGCVATGPGDRAVDGSTVLGAVLASVATDGPLGPAGYAPIEGGAAADAASCDTSAGELVLVDQLLRPRPACGTCDAGALERWPETFRVLDEPPGANCPAGGERIEIAHEGFCPGALADEVHYVCDGQTGEAGDAGAPGPAGPAGEPGHVVVTSPLPAGDASCPYGGLHVEAGVDADVDGVPDVVTSAADVCNGAPAKSGGCAAAPGATPAGASSPATLPLLALLGATYLRRRGRRR